jgi:CubicO group peptidase (beta-lactamase class C family)
MTRRTVFAFSTAVVALTLFSGAPLRGQATLAGFREDLTAQMAAWRIPGMAVAVVKDGQLVFSEGLGVRELGKPAPVDTQTLFAIGSTTKAMTAALMAMLVDEKKVQWNDPVVKHLPWFQLKDPLVTRELTVRDLLTHRGSLGNADYLWYGQNNSTEEILRRVRLIEPGYSLRSRFIYQNVMYAAAGAVIEAASGMRWAEMLRARILQPLDMRDAVALSAELPQRTNVASPHFVIDERVRVIENEPVDAVAAAGSVWASVSDMAKWMQFLLAEGRAGGVNGQRLIGERTFNELFTPQTIAAEGFYPTERLTKPHWKTYALGWFQQDYAGHAVDFHTGSIDGMVAIHGLIRDRRAGVYVLANLDHAELRHAVMLNVFDKLTDRPARDWSGELRALYAGLQKEQQAARAKADAERVANTTPSLALQQYAARYSDPLYGEVDVTFADGRLRLRYGRGFIGTLEHWHYNTFRTKWNAEWKDGGLATFQIGGDGQPSALELMGLRFARVRPAKPAS